MLCAHESVSSPGLRSNFKLWTFINADVLMNSKPYAFLYPHIAVELLWCIVGNNVQLKKSNGSLHWGMELAAFQDFEYNNFSAE
jgi:hypothetical protein